ncbi:MAG: N-acetylglucosamine-6-phosphate deacetylase [Desertifilum sp.]|nr:N-acetylglucosamine-6-phosphate deacetylase [Desertifilum sp.]
MTQATITEITRPLEILNARLLDRESLWRISVNAEGTISTLQPMSDEGVSEAVCLDVAGDWITLGGIDLQINGGLGLAFPDVEPQHLPLLQEICTFLYTQGVDGFLPTLVTTSVEKIARSLSVFAEFQPSQGASVLGVHLEGPFLNRAKRGAHPEEYLLPLSVDNVKRVLGDYASLVKVITLAPELDTTGKVIPYLRSLGITVSLGHSLANAEQAQTAFTQGATMVTHAFNAMPSLHHREPGLLGTAIANPHVQCGLIADGQHVNPIMVDLLLRASHYEQGLFLVSDALAPLGLPDGVYPWDSRQIEIRQGTARLRDRTLAGTTLPLLVGAQNLVKWGICPAPSAIALATSAPRRAIGLPDLAPHQPASLLQWHLEGSTLTFKRVLSVKC